VSRVLVDKIERPKRRNTSAATIAVTACTMEPPGAPESVRPKWVEISFRQPSREATIGVRRTELAPLIAALQAAAAAVCVEV